jgi:hypothetical protein
MTRYAAVVAVLVSISGVVPMIACSSGKSASVLNAQAAKDSGGQAPRPSEGWSASLEADGVKALAADYQRQCGSRAAPSATCETLRSLLVAEVVTALQMMEQSKDQRATEEALAALEIRDEPEIVIAACRILGKFPTTPGIAEKVVPHLASRYVEVQRMAARLLSATPDEGLAEVGRLWSENHGGLPEADAYDEYPGFPSHYTGLGFPKYPGATWFSPADSDRSVGWSTQDDAAKVARWFGEALHAEPQAAEQWTETQAEQMVAAANSFDPATRQRMQQLMEKAITGDQAATAEFEKMQKEIEAATKRATAAIESRADTVANPPTSSARDARWIIAEMQNGRISRMVLVYPVASLQRTVIQLIWDLSVYPSAWPKQTE